jgi:hypothetical protein
VPRVLSLPESPQSEATRGVGKAFMILMLHDHADPNCFSLIEDNNQDIPQQSSLESGCSSDSAIYTYLPSTFLFLQRLELIACGYGQ